LVWGSSQGEVYQQSLAQVSVLVEPPACTSVSLTASPDPGLVSAPVVLSASPQCPGGETPWMQYFYTPLGSTSAPVMVSAGWTTATTLVLPTTGWAAGSYTFSVELSSIDLGAPQQEAQAADTLEASGGIVVPNVPYSPQYYREDCEEAVLEMELAHQGIMLQGNNVQSQSDILGAEGVDQNVPGIGPAYTSGDPMQNYIGPPNGLQSSSYEPGTYYGAVAKAATHFGATVLAAGENISPQQVYAYVEEGHPVQAWVTFDFQPYAPVTLTNGRDSWPWAGPHEHSVLVIGVGVNSVLIDNPWNNSDFGAQYPGADQWVPMSVFQAAYATYFDMAVVISEVGSREQRSPRLAGPR
ncbi:MAG: C39 family peptidase, partial [Candidatus Dormibacteria bacterium]